LAHRWPSSQWQIVIANAVSNTAKEESSSPTDAATPALTPEAREALKRLARALGHAMARNYLATNEVESSAASKAKDDSDVARGVE
jgi:hypothetical protein